MVQAAEELEGAVGQPADEVAGAVEPARRVAAEGIGNEALGGQVRAAEIAAREPAPPIQSSPGTPSGTEMPDARRATWTRTFGSGRPMRVGGAPAVTRSGRRVDRALGRPVDVPEAGAALPAPREGRVAELGVDGFAAAPATSAASGVPFAQAGVEEQPELRRRADRARRAAAGARVSNAARSSRTACGRTCRRAAQASWTSCWTETSKESEALKPTSSAPAFAEAP